MPYLQIVMPCLSQTFIIGHEVHDFLDKIGEVRLLEAEPGSRNPIMFDSWRNVLVMWVGTGQSGLVRMRLRIIPVQYFAIAPDLVAVLADLPGERSKVNRSRTFSRMPRANSSSPLRIATLAPRRTTTSVERLMAE